jgi:hypothetical protein
MTSNVPGANHQAIGQMANADIKLWHLFPIAV